MALALDGTGYTPGASGTTATVNLTTTQTQDVIIVFASINGTTTASIVDTAGLTWTLRQRVSISGPGCIEEWWAIAAGALSSDTITLTFAGTATFASISAQGISGANTTAPFDANASLPATTSTTALVSVSTDAQNTMIIGAYRMSANPNPLAGTGYTQIAGNTGGGFFGSEYLIVSAGQTNIPVAWGGGDVNAGIGDAIAAAAATGTPQKVVYLTNASASTQQWTPPPDCNVIDKIEIWGAGGSGYYSNAARATGAGGGAYTFINGPITTSSIMTSGTVPYVVGPGGTAVTAAPGIGIAGTASWFVATGTYKAVAGAGGATAGSGTVAGGAGGLAASCLPSGNAVSGGNGGTNSSTGGASGGGSSGTPTGAGSSAAAVTTAVAGAGAGPLPGTSGGLPDAAGGNGISGGSSGGGSISGNIAGFGGVPGAGGAAYNFSTTGLGSGAGGRGQIRITYTPQYIPSVFRRPLLQIWDH